LPVIARAARNIAPATAGRAAVPPEQLKLALDQALELTRVLKPTCRAMDGVVRLLESPEAASLADISKKVGALERATDREALKKAVPALGGALAEARQRLDDIGGIRRDVLRRREGLAALAQERGIPHKHGDHCDWLGPFRFDHTEHVAAAKLGRVKLARLRTPSSLEVVRCAEELRRKLEEQAASGWDEFIHAAYRRQEELSSSEPVPWRALVEYALPDVKVRRRKAAVIVYRLALLIFGGAPGGWAFTCVPPTLAEQREAVEVPDLRHPGESVRVVRGRLKKP
jgi:hypothetical protein